METYIFSYSLQKVTAKLSLTELSLKIGFQNFTFAFSEILFFRKFEYSDYDTISIRYLKKGKEKFCEVLSKKGDDNFEALLIALDQLIPEKSLNNTPQLEAFKIMKTVNTQKLAALVTGIVSAILIPLSFWLLHVNNISVGLNLYIILGLIPFAAFYLYFFKYRD